VRRAASDKRGYVNHGGEAWTVIEEREHAKAKERQSENGKMHGRGQIASENFTEAIVTQPQSRDHAAHAVGVRRLPTLCGLSLLPLDAVERQASQRSVAYGCREPGEGQA